MLYTLCFVLWLSLLCRVIVVDWLGALSLLCEVIVVVTCLLYRGCVCWREELCTPNLYLPNPQWRFPVWEVLCGRIVKILLCEGGDVE